MDNSFLGTGWSFPPTFKKKSGVVMVSNEEDIAQSLHILMNTTIGERIMVPDYGSSLIHFLFQPNSVSQNYLMQEMISSAIINYEPRIILNSVSIDQSQYLDGIVRILVDYVISTTNTRFNLVFPYYKEEGTGIPQAYAYQKLTSLK